jgi:hypothetical protein
VWKPIRRLVNQLSSPCEHRRTFSRKATLLLMLSVACTVGCQSDVAWPEPARPARRRERDDWIKPGRMVQLRRVSLRSRGVDTMRVRNDEPFDVTLLDDIRLTVSAPHVQTRRGGPYIGDRRHAWYVYLRCPTSRTIPSGSQIEFSVKECLITTYEPGPDAQLIGFRLVAREGFVQTGIEGGPPIVRDP